MTPTDELIRALRAWAAAFRVKDGMGQLTKDLAAAADRLEEMDERIAIIGEPGAVLISRKLTAQEREAVWEAFRSNSPIYASIERMGDQFSIQSMGPLRVTEDAEKRFCGLIEEE